MPALIRASGSGGAKRWFVVSAVGDDRRRKDYPAARSRSEAHDLIAADAGIPRTANVPLALTRKSLTPDMTWVDD